MFQPESQRPRLVAGKQTASRARWHLGGDARVCGHLPGARSGPLSGPLRLAALRLRKALGIHGDVTWVSRDAGL